MKFPAKETVQQLRKDFPEGATVELDFMDDPFSTMPHGLRGTVSYIDDAGTIHVKWENGSTLGVAYGADSCHVADKEAV